MVRDVNGRCTALALAVLAVGAKTAAAAATEVVVLPITFHVAQIDGEPVVPPAFITERLMTANQIFAPYGVAFAQAATLPLDAQHSELESRGDRDALGAEVGRGVIDCFVVRSLRDVDEPPRLRRGVHWHSHTHPGAHFVILSSIAGPDVLAHELGHFLGNPAHSQTPGNLMSYQRGDQPPFLDPDQVARLERALHGYLRRGELHALSSKPN
ncbi:MAG: hypothetical protein ACHQ53_15715 [Polyangiales bacterium]